MHTLACTPSSLTVLDRDCAGLSRARVHASVYLPFWSMKSSKRPPAATTAQAAREPTCRQKLAVCLYQFFIPTGLFFCLLCLINRYTALALLL